MIAQYVGCIDMLGLDRFERCEPMDEVDDLLQAFAVDRKQMPEGRGIGYVMRMIILRATFNSHRYPIPFVCRMEERLGEAIVRSDFGVPAAVLVLRGAEEIGFSQTRKSDWEVLQKLVPEFKALLVTYSGERFEVQT